MAPFPGSLIADGDALGVDRRLLRLTEDPRLPLLPMLLPEDSLSFTSLHILSLSLVAPTPVPASGLPPPPPPLFRCTSVSLCLSVSTLFDALSSSLLPLPSCRVHPLSLPAFDVPPCLTACLYV